MAMMKLLEETLLDREVGRIAEHRLTAIQCGEDELLEADDFFAQADALLTKQSR